MSTIALNEASFESTVHDNDIVLIDFWAAWCGPCRQFGPVFERASAKHPDITFAKVDTEAEPGLAAAFEIRSIPTLMAVREGVVLYAQPGALPEAALENLIAQVRQIDMDDVRRQVSAQQPK